MAPVLISDQKHIATCFVIAYALTKVSVPLFIRESGRLDCTGRDGVSAVLLLNRRFKCLALLEVSDPVYSIIVKGKWKNELRRRKSGFLQSSKYYYKAPCL